MRRWILPGSIAAMLAVLAAQLAWTDWSFKSVERCGREAEERLGFERVAGVDGVDTRPWPPGLRCRVLDCPGWESRPTAATRRCRAGSANRVVELAATPLDWIVLLSFAAAGSAGLIGIAIVPFALLRYRRGPERSTSGD